MTYETMPRKETKHSVTPCRPLPWPSGEAQRVTSGRTPGGSVASQYWGLLPVEKTKRPLQKPGVLRSRSCPELRSGSVRRTCGTCGVGNGWWDGRKPWFRKPWFLLDSYWDQHGLSMDDQWIGTLFGLVVEWFINGWLLLISEDLDWPWPWSSNSRTEEWRSGHLDGTLRMI